MKKNIFPALFGLLIVAATALSIYHSWKSPVVCSLNKGETLYGLVVGTDFVDNARHSDTILFVRYQPQGQKMDLLSIPRDTRVNPPGIRVHRINEVYAHAYKASQRNPAQACRVLWESVSSLLFTSTQTAAPALHFYAQIDYDGFRKMIDLLGGVDISVEEPMNYDDNWGKLHIHFSTGAQHMNGAKALEYVRFRGGSGDYGRSLRQQQFLLKVLNRFTNPANILKLPKIVLASMGAVQTNLTVFERLLALYELRGLTKNQVRLLQLPGHAQNGYWIPDRADVDATALSLQNETQGGPAQVFSEKAEVPFSKVTVEVWNASNKKLAMTVVHRLRDAGFDVVKWGNYTSRQQRTMVRDHRGNPKAAQMIAEALRSPAEVFTRIETDPLVDIEVILGEDYGNQKREE